MHLLVPGLLTVDNGNAGLLYKAVNTPGAHHIALGHILFAYTALFLLLLEFLLQKLNITIYLDDSSILVIKHREPLRIDLYFIRQYLKRFQYASELTL